MNPSTLIAPPSSTPHHPSFHSSSTFLNPLPLRTTTNSKLTKQRRRFRISIPRSSSDQPAPSTSSPPVFGDKRDLTGIQPLVAKLSPPVRLASSALLIGAAIAAGYGLGSRFGKEQKNVATLGGAAVLGAAGAAAAYALNAAVPDVAATELHNYAAGCDDPKALNKDNIEMIAKKYLFIFFTLTHFIDFIVIWLSQIREFEENMQSKWIT